MMIVKNYTIIGELYKYNILHNKNISHKGCILLELHYFFYYFLIL